MHEKFTSVLRCPEPDCNGDLEITERTTTINGEVIDGTLTCLDCGRDHRIRDGFPILLAEQIDDENALS
ncbi:hypothetical protein EFA46_007475 [Halarchaeum sp. CBA1220]|uniref:Trm112 family protein n=1 Tax=Halarchaeum sp. CBA1220 TaxID=1853682 RepID=UPI000F3A99AF|nr:Trm112 family protein [Halarchaeum sp. CBA1220]QLC34049.1 hypothetical protein EFA46_007475 [Halarchaeum sp. CBA1220]